MPVFRAYFRTWLKHQAYRTSCINIHFQFYFQPAFQFGILFLRVWWCVKNTTIPLPAKEVWHWALYWNHYVGWSGIRSFRIKCTKSKLLIFQVIELNKNRDSWIVDAQDIILCPVIHAPLCYVPMHFLCHTGIAFWSFKSNKSFEKTLKYYAHLSVHLNVRLIFTMFIWLFMLLEMSVLMTLSKIFV